MPIYDIEAPDGSIIEVEAPDGATEQQVMEFAQSQFAEQGAIDGVESYAFFDKETGSGGFGGTLPNIEPSFQERAITNVVAPVNEAIGLVAGGIAGTPAGPLGQAGGAGGGYAIAKNINDQLLGLVGGDQRQYDNLIQAAQVAAEDAAFGASLEMGGQAIAAPLGWVAGKMQPVASKIPVIGRPFGGRGLPSSQTRASVEAGDVLLGAEAKTAEELAAQQTEKRITQEALERSGAPMLAEGQLTGNQGRALIEQAQSKTGAEFGGRVLRTDKQAAEAARNNVENIIKGEVSGIGATTQETGGLLSDAIEGERILAKRLVDDLYGKLPDKLPMDKGELPKKVMALIKDININKETAFLTGQAKQAISNLTSILKNFKKQPQVEINALKNVRDQLADAASAAYSAGDRRSWMFTKRFIDAIDSEMANASGVAGKYAQDYQAARAASGAYQARFGKGVVGDITSVGQKFGGTKVTPESLPSQFWGKGRETNVDQLIDVLGKDKAKALILDNAIHDAQLKINSAKAATKWLQQNKPIMDKAGITAKDVISKERLKTLLIGDGETVTMKTLEKNLTNAKPILKEMFSASERQALKDYHQILKAVGRNKNITAGGGSTTADALTMSEGRDVGKIVQGVAQLGALKAGMGYAYNAILNVTKSMVNLGVRTPQSRAQLLEAAAYDPALAKDLMKLAKSAPSKGIRTTGPEISRYLRELNKASSNGFVGIPGAARPKSIYAAPYQDLIQQELGGP